MIEQPSVMTGLYFLLQNVQSLTADKEDQVRKLVDQLSIDVLFLVETWKLVPGKQIGEISYSSRAQFSYVEYANYYNKRGIQFRVSNHFEPLVHHSLSQQTSGADILSIQVNGALIIGVYMPNGYAVTGISEVIVILERAFEEFHGPIIVLGDFNTKSLTQSNHTTNVSGLILDEWLPSSPYIYHDTTGPTYVTEQCQSYLDVFLTSRINPSSCNMTLYDEVTSPHRGLAFKSQWNLENSSSFIRNPIPLKSIDKRLAQALKNKITMRYEDFSLLVKEESHKSWKRKTSSHRKPKHHWFVASSALKGLTKSMWDARRTHQWTEFKDIRRSYRSLLRKEKRAAFQNMLKEAEHAQNPREFFQVVKRTKPGAKWVSNTGHGREDAIAQELTHIQSSRSDSRSFVDLESSRLSSLPSELFKQNNLTEVRLDELLKAVKKRKSPGPSGITYEHLSSLSPPAKKMLLLMINYEITKVDLDPTLFRTFVRPLAKKPGTSSFRPISLLETITKIIDRYYLGGIYEFINTRGLCSDQFGFKKNRSATDQLVRLTSDIARLRDSKKHAVLISLDLKGAYDRVDSKLLYTQLKADGCPEQYLPYLFALLFKREFKVTTLYHQSKDWIQLTEGIAQGLPSGPILFNYYIDPVLRKIQTVCDGQYSYADDNNVLLIAKYNESLLSFLRRVEKVINLIKQWYGELNCILSVDKSKLLAYNFKPKVTQLKGLVFVEQVKILGIYFDRLFRFNYNTEILRSKLSQTLNWICVFKNALQAQKRKTLYEAFFKSVLCYHIVPTWPFLTNTNKERLLKLVSKGARFILNVTSVIHGPICIREAQIMEPSLASISQLISRYFKLNQFEQENTLTKGYRYLLRRHGFDDAITDFSQANMKNHLNLLREASYSAHWESYYKNPKIEPERALCLYAPPLDFKSYGPRDQLLFKIRTRTLKLKPWRLKHGQPYERSRPDDLSCRFCLESEETLAHILAECTHAPLVQSRKKLINSINQNLTNQFHVNWWNLILIRSFEPNQKKLQSKLMKEFFTSIDPNNALSLTL